MTEDAVVCYLRVSCSCSQHSFHQKCKSKTSSRKLHEKVSVQRDRQTGCRRTTSASAMLTRVRRASHGWMIPTSRSRCSLFITCNWWAELHLKPRPLTVTFTCLSYSKDFIVKLIINSIWGGPYIVAINVSSIFATGNLFYSILLVKKNEENLQIHSWNQTEQVKLLFKHTIRSCYSSFSRMFFWMLSNSVIGYLDSLFNAVRLIFVEHCDVTDNNSNQNIW